MEALDYWKLCERVSIFQAVMLIIGQDPGSVGSQFFEKGDEYNNYHPRHLDGYGAVKTALLVAVGKGLLSATPQEMTDFDSEGNEIGPFPGTVDIDKTFVSVSAIRTYLRERNFSCDFFGWTDDFSIAAYLDPTNACYAPKLAAAVEAWTAITTDGSYEHESTPKQLMEKWLRENAVRFSLNKLDGKLNEDAIAQITKIANWRPEGGAAKTPGSKKPPTPQKTAF